MQDDDAFVAGAASPFLPVDKKEATYYTYVQGDWQRREMKVRGTGQRAHRAGWRHSTDSYHCERYAVAHEEDWADSADSDEAFNIDEDNSAWLADQVMIDVDYKWQATVMLPATWTTDWDGVAAAPGASELLQWNDGSSDPQKDILNIQSAVHALIGRYGNVMVVGADVHTNVVTNAVVRDAIKHTDKTFTGTITHAQLASFFGVEKYTVARGIHNTGVEGATVSMGYLVNEKDLWLGYVNPNPGKRKMSATYTFAWKGPEGVGQDGVATRKFDDTDRKITVYEVETYHDVKIVAADAGAFVDDCVA
jgi:hypothetical protein